MNNGTRELQVAGAPESEDIMVALEDKEVDLSITMAIPNKDVELLLHMIQQALQDSYSHQNLQAIGPMAAGSIGLAQGLERRKL